MAIPVQGFTVSWGTAVLQEVQTFDVNRERGLPVGRVETWTPTLGTIELSSFSTAHLSESEYGRRKRLKLEGRTATSGAVFTFFDRDCILENARTQVLTNDAVRLAFTFRIQDTVDAPTNP